MSRMVEILSLCHNFHLLRETGQGAYFPCATVSSFQDHGILRKLQLVGPLVKGVSIGKCWQLHRGLFCFPQGLLV